MNASSLMNPVRNIALHFLNMYINVILQFMSDCTFELKPSCLSVNKIQLNRVMGTENKRYKYNQPLAFHALVESTIEAGTNM